MAIRFLFILFLSLIGFLSVSAQTTIVPDSNFRKFLVEKYPSVMDANKAIIDAKAAAVTGNFDCPKRQITNMAGIEKFKSISAIFCSGNQIDQLDSISNLTKLTLLDCHDNPLNHLPNLSRLNNLYYLWCSGCGLSQSLDLSANPLMATLNCYDNQIPQIIGLENLTNLTSLNCYGNPLTKLPSLSALTKLLILQCFDNQLTELPDLSTLTSLQTLVAGGNQISIMPDLKNLTKLKTIKFWNNKLSVTPDLSNQPLLELCEISYNKLTSLPDFKNNLNVSTLNFDGNLIDSVPDYSHLKLLTVVKLSNNSIRQAPDLSSSKNTLNELRLSGNKLSSLPDFQSFTALKTLNVQNNQLTFEDLLPVLKDTSVKQFNYSPQANVGIETTFSITESQAFVLKNGIDSSISTNRYDWFKNGLLVKSTTNDSLLISSVQLTDSGTYTCNITNAALPSLTLSRSPLKLLVKNCLDLSSFKVNINEYECNKGGSMSLQPSTILGGTPPYRFTLTSTLNKEVITPNGNLFDHLYESNFTMTIKDSKNCIAYRDIQLNGKKPEDCETLVIVYEDNKSNYLSFEDKGIAKVYNKSGKLVNSFTTPANWEGTLENGTIVPGFYIVELNGKNFQVTVIK